MEENTAKQGSCYGISCKICTSCYPNRKKPIYSKKTIMKILGIGNAIVDVLCKVSNEFLKKILYKKYNETCR
jgi:hypothetical protein